MGPVYGEQTALGIKIMLDKIAGREFGSRVFQGRREHSYDFVRVDKSALAHTNDFPLIFA